MNVNKIAGMITEICGAPNAIASGKARHLRNQAWLSQDNLINRSAITRFSLSWTTNASTVFTFLRAKGAYAPRQTDTQCIMVVYPHIPECNEVTPTSVPIGTNG